jgi:predicted aldo/keto reductase-like oxidoreductase
LGRTSLWIVGFLGVLAFGYFVLGGLLHALPIGLDWTAFPAGGVIESVTRALGYSGPNAISSAVWFLLALLGGMVLAFVLARGARVASVDVERRSLLTGAATGVLAALGAGVVAGGAAAARALLGIGREHPGWGPVQAGINADVVKTHPEYLEDWKGARVAGHRRLGRTGWKISDIVLGSGRVKGEKGVEVVRSALDRGVTYVDTAPDYSATGSEEAVGEALEGRRGDVFLATKFCTPWGHLGTGTPVAEYKAVIEASLKRLRTDYVDLVHIHACDDVDRLMDPNVHEAFDRLKEEGKVRFLGSSSHTPNLQQVAQTAIDSGRFDVMMLAYHHGIWPQLGELIQRARREQDMGVVAMKTLKGAKHTQLAGFEEQADSYAQAALRWVLSNPDVSAAIISFFEHQHVDEYLRASGGGLGPEDVALLGEYDRRIAGTYCAPHCGACLSSCPADVPIHDVLRHRMYFEDYGNEKEAMRLYSRLERDASACTGCSAPCLGSCPLGLPIQERLEGAHDLLTLS